MVSQTRKKGEEGSLASYITGFILSIIFTFVAYFAVVGRWMDRFGIIALISVLAIAQALIQLLFFLHLGSETRPRWKQMIFAFMLLVVCILVGGTLWIMHNLNYNMMGG